MSIIYTSVSAVEGGVTSFTDCGCKSIDGSVVDAARFSGRMAARLAPRAGKAGSCNTPHAKHALVHETPQVGSLVQWPAIASTLRISYGVCLSFGGDS